MFEKYRDKLNEFKFISDEMYHSNASDSACIIRINDLNHNWEKPNKIALYKDELRIECNLKKLEENKSLTKSKQDGLSIEQEKLISHVIDENLNLGRRIIISSTNIELIQKIFKGEIND